jgi:putative membrane protein insertion efficiency factor
MRDLSRSRQKNSFTWNPATAILLGSLKAYKALVSPLIRSRCRFVPTCSEYAAGAVKKHGAGRGLFLSAKRLLKCNRLFSGGYDPVP